MIHNHSQSAESYYAAYDDSQRWILRTISGIIVLIPLAYAFPLAPNFAAIIFRVLVAVLLGTLFLSPRIRLQKKYTWTFVTMNSNAAVFLFCFYSLLSVFLAPRNIWRFSFTEFSHMASGALIYFTIAYHARRSEQLTRLMRTLFLLAGAMASLGIFTSSLDHRTIRVILFGDAQLFGGFLTLLLPFTVVASLTEKITAWQTASRISAVMVLACLIMTGTRTAWSGSLASLIVLFLLFYKFRDKDSQRLLRRSSLVPMLVVMSGILAFGYTGGFSQVFTHRGTKVSAQSSLAYREKMWSGALELAKNKPIFGHGLNSFPFMVEGTIHMGRPRSAVMESAPALDEMAHSFWFQMAAEQGLVGIILFAGILFQSLLAGGRNLSRLEDGPRKSLLIASMAALVGFSIDAIGNPAWQFAQISIFFWIVLGMSAASTRPLYYVRPIGQI